MGETSTAPSVTSPTSYSALRSPPAARRSANATAATQPSSSATTTGTGQPKKNEKPGSDWVPNLPNPVAAWLMRTQSSTASTEPPSPNGSMAPTVSVPATARPAATPLQYRR